MAYNGHIENGKVVFDGPVPLAQGTPVHVYVAHTTENAESDDGPSLAERLASVIASIEGLPEDAAENLEHYLYGSPNAHSCTQLE